MDEAMPRAKQDAAAAPPETLTLEHVPADGLRAVYADSTTLVPASDGTGALVRFAFTRTETVVLSETIPVRREGKGLRATGQPHFDSVQRKVVEALVLMRPDQALQLSKAILINLSNLPDEVKKKYAGLSELPTNPQAGDSK